MKGAPEPKGDEDDAEPRDVTRATEEAALIQHSAARAELGRFREVRDFHVALRRVVAE